MPSLIAENVVQVVMEYTGGGATMSNVYHVHKATPWTEANLLSLETAFLGWETDTGSDNRAQDVALTRIKLTDLTSLASPMRDTILGVPIPGKQLSGMLPANSTIAFKGSIGERGRGRAGRQFWIGLAEDMCAGCSIDTDAGGDITANLEQLRTEIAALPLGALLGIIHTVVSGAPISPATFSAIVAWVLTDRTLDSQKNRLPNHKRRKVTP